MAREPKPASADTVRAWAVEEGWTDEFGRAPKDRGRLNSALVEAFNKAHKRNNLVYMPGFKDEAPAAPKNEVATRTPAKPTPAAPAPRQSRSRQEKDETPVRVESTRGPAVTSNSGNGDGGMTSLADAIAMLQSAATAKKGGRPALITIQTLVNV